MRIPSRTPSNEERAQNLQRTRMIPALAANIDGLDEIERLVSDAASKMGVTESDVILKIRERFSEGDGPYLWEPTQSSE